MSSTYVTRDICTRIPGGDGSHKIQFMYWEDDTEPFGLIEHHKYADDGSTHCGYIAWRAPKDGSAFKVLHQLVSGGPEDIEHLTVSPSLLCGNRHVQPCVSHGFIADGEWRDA